MDSAEALELTVPVLDALVDGEIVIAALLVRVGEVEREPLELAVLLRDREELRVAILLGDPVGTPVEVLEVEA